MPAEEDIHSHYVQRARSTYDQAPSYDESLYAHPVYAIAPELFQQPVNAWDLSDGTNFISAIARPELKIASVQFIDKRNRSEQGTATLVQVSSYYFDSVRNSVRFLDLSGQIHEIPVEQYGVAYPTDRQQGDSIRMRIPSDVSRDDISVEFFLKAHVPDPTPGFAPTIDTDHIVIETVSDGSESKKKKTRALHRHADYYVNLLLLLDVEEDWQQLFLEMDQINEAVKRINIEEVGTIFHPGLINAKLKSVSGMFADLYVGKLIQGQLYTAKDLELAGVAIDFIEKNLAQSDVQVPALKFYLNEAKKLIS